MLSLRTLLSKWHRCSDCTTLIPVRALEPGTTAYPHIRWKLWRRKRKKHIVRTQNHRVWPGPNRPKGYCLVSHRDASNHIDAKNLTLMPHHTRLFSARFHQAGCIVLLAQDPVKLARRPNTNHILSLAGQRPSKPQCWCVALAGALQALCMSVSVWQSHQEPSSQSSASMPGSTLQLVRLVSPNIPLHMHQPPGGELLALPGTSSLHIFQRFLSENHRSWRQSLLWSMLNSCYRTGQQVSEGKCAEL